MQIYLVYECYFNDSGHFKKVLRKIYDEKYKVTQHMDNYQETMLQWCECEERNLE